MLNVEIDGVNGIAILKPHGPLSAPDFVKVAEVIDPYIAKYGSLLGIIIFTEEFPGWDSFGALVDHIKFVKAHHTKLSKLAIVTNSKIGDLGEKLGKHFLSAEIKHFSFDQFGDAKTWMLSGVRK